MEKLKECPFCGGEATRLLGTALVRCQNQSQCSCGWVGEEHWNTRHAAPVERPSELPEFVYMREKSVRELPKTDPMVSLEPWFEAPMACYKFHALINPQESESK